MVLKKKIIIGVDPGTQVTGFGIILIDQGNFVPLDFGCIRPPPKAPLSDRYLIISEGLKALLHKYNPCEMAIETPFVYKNVQGALKLGIALGIALISAKERKMKVFGYSPKEVKCSIAGTGRASKEQVLGSVTRFLQLKKPPSPQDAADALAIAICHSQYNPSILLGGKKKEL
jgi:crossover junction endodeoxyribonuclease RuvC